MNILTFSVTLFRALLPRSGLSIFQIDNHIIPTSHFRSTYCTTSFVLHNLYRFFSLSDYQFISHGQANLFLVILHNSPCFNYLLNRLFQFSLFILQFLSVSLFKNSSNNFLVTYNDFHKASLKIKVPFAYVASI